MSEQKAVSFLRPFMLLAWSFAGLVTVLETHYCLPRDPNPKVIFRPLDPMVISIAAFAILSCGGCRYWLSHMRKTGWTLIPYFLGLMFTWFAAMYGVFLLPEYLLFFQVIAGAFFIAYFPFLVQFKPASPPPLPKPVSDAVAP